MGIYSTKLYLNFSLRSQKRGWRGSSVVRDFAEDLCSVLRNHWWLTPPLTSDQGDQMLFSDFHMRHAHSTHTHSHTNRQTTHKYKIKINIKKERNQNWEWCHRTVFHVEG